MINMNSVGALNLLIREGKIKNFIMLSHAMHKGQIVAIANQIYENYKSNGTRVILIAGPSASGKSNYFIRSVNQFSNFCNNLINPITNLGFETNNSFSG